ncbi:MAG: sterol desaturase family protein [Legionella sp.]|nr:MAG: sterol desaturase family protein [Legionella sp.]
MVFAAPMFLLLILIEFSICYFKKYPHYQFNDAINNISSGIFEEIAALPARGLIIFSYYYLYEHYAFFTISAESIFTWIILWLAVDFTYYWFHRVSHRNNFFWLGHSVHHQSELYNLSVALRQGYFQSLTSWVFYLPLALIGFPTWMFVIVLGLNTVYQFWLHTQTINKMGWFETLFNTPSHHRVHHGTNPQYIDKNYAGSLIIWDKLFGTFEPEKEPVNYGVTEPLHTWNPFVANFKVLQDLFYYGKNLRNKATLLQAPFRPPEWIIKRLQAEGTLVSKRIVPPKNTHAPRAFMILNIAYAIGSYTYVSFVFNPNLWVSWLLVILILASLGELGFIANGQQQVLIPELLRTALLALILYLLALPLWPALLFFAVNQALLQYGTVPSAHGQQVQF